LALKLIKSESIIQKGIFITTSTFQESALNIARAEGIGLIRIISDNELQWINYRKSSRSITNIDNEQTNKLINVDFNSEPFICSINNNTITNFADLLLELSIIDVFNDNEEYINIPFITHNRFNEIVNKLIEKNVYDGVTLNIDKIVQFLEPIYGLKFEFDTVENDNYLGKIEFEPLRVKISNKARIDKNMWRFTVAHEIGHLILHSPILKERIKEKSDDEKSLTFRFSETNNNRDKIEIQANLFASYLLMPEIKLLQIIQSIFKKYNIHKNYLYLDSQPVNQKEVYEILYNLSEIFQVSVAVVKIRLIKLKLLEDKTDYKLSTIMRNYRL
jgi:Zn-dependent peptidase ImmA (M78 family)